jgi:hypothetical protein
MFVMQSESNTVWGVLESGNGMIARAPGLSAREAGIDEGPASTENAYNPIALDATGPLDSQ